MQTSLDQLAKLRMLKAGDNVFIRSLPPTKNYAHKALLNTRQKVWSVEHSPHGTSIRIENFPLDIHSNHFEILDDAAQQ